MRRWSLLSFGVLFCLLALPYRAPAPLIFTPGEGWRYEKVGEDKSWQRTRAKDQFQVAQDAYTKKDYSLTAKAARRVVSQWPYSDYAPQAQYLLARGYEEKGKLQEAFKQYQKLLEKYPKADNYQEALTRQFTIANAFLNGKWYRLWGYIPVGPSMSKTIQMYEKVIKNGPYSEVAPQAQLNIATAYQKKKVLCFKAPEYPEAVKAYERAADRYSDREKVAAEALYKAGLTYQKQAKAAEYDQSIAGNAIAAFTDLATLHPADSRVPEAQKRIDSLRTEQARGSYEIARYYEKRKKWQGAQIYYNEVLQKDPNSRYAAQARQRILELKKHTEGTGSPTPAAAPAPAVAAPSGEKKP